jgi:hypothetical protein
MGGVYSTLIFLVSVRLITLNLALQLQDDLSHWRGFQHRIGCYSLYPIVTQRQELLMS